MVHVHALQCVCVCVPTLALPWQPASATPPAPPPDCCPAGPAGEPEGGEASTVPAAQDGASRGGGRAEEEQGERGETVSVLQVLAQNSACMNLAD